ncbi:hypothetical protein JW756_02245 [Candidatus Woesearchaeota archaeon]|nr:hypothetical protein [Candidatus Woesearchaeota archaeon]
MAEEKTNYSFAIIAMVAIVAIVGLAVMFMKAKALPSESIDTGLQVEQLGVSTDTELFYDEEGNLVGEAASATKCTETDKGKTYTTRGTTKLGTQSNKDECVAAQDGGSVPHKISDYVKEYYCENNKIQFEVHKCNGLCINGKCTTATCSDYDDGKTGTTRFKTKGIAYYFNQDDVTDSCNGDKLKEALCNKDGKATTTDIDCTKVLGAGYTCIEGACKLGCQDKDPGANTPVERYMIKGEAIKPGSQPLPDKCNGDKLQEAHCVGGEANYTSDLNCSIEVGLGSKCVNGACTKPAAATTGTLKIVGNTKLEGAMLFLNGKYDQTLTTSEAVAEIKGITKGTYKVIIAKANCKIIQQSAKIEAGKTTQLYFTC